MNIYLYIFIYYFISSSLNFFSYSLSIDLNETQDFSASWSSSQYIFRATTPIFQNKYGIVSHPPPCTHRHSLYLSIFLATTNYIPTPLGKHHNSHTAHDVCTQFIRGKLQQRESSGCSLVCFGRRRQRAMSTRGRLMGRLGVVSGNIYI